MPISLLLIAVFTVTFQTKTMRNLNTAVDLKGFFWHSLNSILKHFSRQRTCPPEIRIHSTLILTRMRQLPTDPLRQPRFMRQN